MNSDRFYFRAFSMTQAPSGQRVNTDSCVFGDVIGGLSQPLRILDIGTGTGVLALMLAARYPGAMVTAVEPEVSIARVAAENFKSSPWSERIQLVIARAQELDPAEIGTFDFVLCNPPYFQNSLLSDDRLRMIARHNMDLSVVELYDAMGRMVTEHGSMWLSFPEDSLDLWLRHGTEGGFHLTHQFTVMDHPGARPHMTIAGWGRNVASEVKRADIFYRTHHKGPPSDWMSAFRERWFPARFNANFK